MIGKKSLTTWWRVGLTCSTSTSSFTCTNNQRTSSQTDTTTSITTTADILMPNSIAPCGAAQMDLFDGTTAMSMSLSIVHLYINQSIYLLSNKGPKATYKSHMYKIVHRKDSLHFTYSTTFVKYASWSHPVEDWVHDGETFRRLNNGRANVTCLWQILSLNFNFYSGSTALNWLRSPGESVRYKAAEPLNFIGIRQDAVLIRLAIVTLWPSIVQLRPLTLMFELDLRGGRSYKLWRMST